MGSKNCVFFFKSINQLINFNGRNYLISFLFLFFLPSTSPIPQKIVDMSIYGNVKVPAGQVIEKNKIALE